MNTNELDYVSYCDLYTWLYLFHVSSLVILLPLFVNIWVLYLDLISWYRILWIWEIFAMKVTVKLFEKQKQYLQMWSFEIISMKLNPFTQAHLQCWIQACFDGITRTIIVIS